MRATRRGTLPGLAGWVARETEAPVRCSGDRWPSRRCYARSQLRAHGGLAAQFVRQVHEVGGLNIGGRIG